MSYRILRLADVIKKTGMSRATTYRLIKEGSFPAPINLGANSVGWVESEVDEWIGKKISARDQMTEAVTLSM